MAIIIGAIGSDAGYTIIYPDGTVYHSPGWGEGQLDDFMSAVHVIHSASQFEAPGVAAEALKALARSSKKNLRRMRSSMQAIESFSWSAVNRENLDKLRELASDAEQRYVAWFHALDAWTEYWDVYHPENRGQILFWRR